jgi:hypothetical protein
MRSYLEMALDGPLDEQTRDNLTKSVSAANVSLYPVMYAVLNYLHFGQNLVFAIYNLLVRGAVVDPMDSNIELMFVLGAELSRRRK